VAGRTLATSLPAGADVTQTAIRGEAGDAAGAPVRRGERVAEVIAAGSPELVVTGARVDVLVTREPRPGSPGGTELALEDVEVLQASPGPETGGSDRAGTQTVAASLRVTLRQAVFLAAAQSYARELRLLPRAAGDRGHASGTVAYGSDLG
jgi:pilus assembly protein CpaB